MQGGCRKGGLGIGKRARQQCNRLAARHLAAHHRHDRWGICPNPDPRKLLTRCLPNLAQEWWLGAAFGGEPYKGPDPAAVFAGLMAAKGMNSSHLESLMLHIAGAMEELGMPAVSGGRARATEDGGRQPVDCRQRLAVHRDPPTFQQPLFRPISNLRVQEAIESALQAVSREAKQVQAKAGAVGGAAAPGAAS